ncbi:MAG: hypothetical protein J0I10_19995 [Verrucomicrobia bacterium]|nr:hypothetical protein [Verrucomicrobiota bacterium]
MQALASLLLIALAWMDSPTGPPAVAKAPTVFTTFPQLLTATATTRYYRATPEIWGHLTADTTRPSFAGMIARSEAIEAPTPDSGYIEVVTIWDAEFFVLIHGGQSTGSEPETTVYRVTPFGIEQVNAGGKMKTLRTTETGVSKWSYEYNAQGRIRRLASWFLPLESGSIHPIGDLFLPGTKDRYFTAPGDPPTPKPPRLISETLYDYWPDTGKLRTITSHSRCGGLKTSVRHFDENGNELKEPK